MLGISLSELSKKWRKVSRIVKRFGKYRRVEYWKDMENTEETKVELWNDMENMEERQVEMWNVIPHIKSYVPPLHIYPFIYRVITPYCRA
jgi:hypothetical protein